MEIPVNNIPDNNIIIFRNDYNWLPDERVDDFIKRPLKTRDWFTPHFYRCLPLTIGNLYGFTIHSPLDFNAVWDGSDSQDSISFTYFEPENEQRLNRGLVSSHFGFGILTISLPFHLKTPKGVNLITVNPTNHIIPNITVMTGVIEADNIQTEFTLNLKMQEPNRLVHINKGDPLTTIIPIPRYYQDNFVLKVAENALDESVITNETQTNIDHMILRESLDYKKTDRNYLTGQNVYGETFPDHQTNINYEA